MTKTLYKQEVAPVKAGIRGFGNLVILEHADNYFTVYGFNAQNLVKVGNFVGQGEKVALSGTPPDSKTPATSL